MAGSGRRASTDALERREIGGRIRDVREAQEWDRAELARRLRVHPGSIARWETGGAVPQPHYVRRLAQIGGVTEAWIRYGDGEPPEPKRKAQPGPDDEGGFLSLDALSGFIGEIAPPGQEVMRKIDALEAYRRLITTRHTLPSWWYRLRDTVERGDL